MAVAFFDVKRLTQGLEIGPAFAPAPLFAADDRQKCRVEIPERMVGRVIGKKGATFAKIREACPQVFVEVASKQHALKDTRLVTLRAQASADIARCLDAIAAKVPDLQPVTDAAKTDLLEDVGVLRWGRASGGLVVAARSLVSPRCVDLGRISLPVQLSCDDPRNSGWRGATHWHGRPCSS